MIYGAEKPLSQGEDGFFVFLQKEFEKYCQKGLRWLLGAGLKLIRRKTNFPLSL